MSFQHPFIIRAISAGLIALGLAGAASAEIVAEKAWARATPPGFSKGAVYVELINDGRRSDVLIGVDTDRAPRAEMHRTIEEGGNSRMVHTPNVPIPAGEGVSFEPGGRHVMLMGVDEPLAEGERFTITLSTEDNGTLPIEVRVLPPTAMGID